MNLYRLREVLTEIDRPDLKYPAFTPSVPAALEVGDDDLFETIARQDILLHHPYQSFAPVLDFIRSSALDPRVVAIKQTVYRTGAVSELMQILIDAARAGKEVTVVVELLARFDEEANLNWAAQLEAVGAHVVYGVVGHKTHAKMALIVRREPGPEGTVLRRYAHLGTGNYHSATARQYTDFGLLTANEEICSDVNEVFKQLTGLGRAGRLKHVWQSPFTLHKRVVEAIRNEARIASEGRPARIVAKMNALLEPGIIDELYAASKAGVKVDLIVRGICALKPGVEGLSENIRVRSIVGRFLEHSRVFWFRNDGADDVWLSSADWMDRNFFRRIELAFPVLDERLKRRVIKEGLKPYLDDNCQSWIMDGDGRLPPPAAEGRQALFRAGRTAGAAFERLSVTGVRPLLRQCLPDAFAPRVGGAGGAAVGADDEAVQAGLLAAAGLHGDAARRERVGDARRELRDLAVVLVAARDHVRQFDRLLQRQLPGEQADERLRVVGEDGRAARRAERRDRAAPRVEHDHRRHRGARPLAARDRVRDRRAVDDRAGTRNPSAGCSA